MHFTIDQLKAAVHALHEARRNPATRCGSPRLDADGEASFVGTGAPVAYGPHGGAWLAIDPATGEIICNACRSVGPTARPKKVVTRRTRDGATRPHAVSV